MQTTERHCHLQHENISLLPLVSRFTRSFCDILAIRTNHMKFQESSLALSSFFILIYIFLVLLFRSVLFLGLLFSSTGTNRYTIPELLFTNYYSFLPITFVYHVHLHTGSI